MAGELEVVNEALIKLGASPLASLNDAGAQATTARALLRTTVTRLLSETPWFWALRKVNLPEIELGEDEFREFGRYTHVYQMPPDLIRSIGLECRSDFRLLRDRLFTRAKPAHLLYVFEAEVERWPGYFRELVVDTMAGNMAISVTDSANRAQMWMDKANQARQRAMAIDAQQTPPEVFNLMQVYLRRTSNPLAVG
ncbi:MAG: hypothetical protein EA406_02195 [Rhodospirillales bacterium]|nr:MAG: hypothetical protein EA406_02195 [Rhodospirillales bacterium]